MKEKFKRRTHGTIRQIGTPFIISSSMQASKSNLPKIHRKRNLKLHGTVTVKGETFKVVMVKDKFNKYFEGMNWYAANWLNIPYPYGKNTIAIFRTAKDKQWLKKHEALEAIYMEQGNSYPIAHSKVLLEMGDSNTIETAMKDAHKMVGHKIKS